MESVEKRKKERAEAEETEKPRMAMHSEPDKRRSGSDLFFHRPPTSPLLWFGFTGKAGPALFISTLVCFSTMDGLRRLWRDGAEQKVNVITEIRARARRLSTPL